MTLEILRAENGKKLLNTYFIMCIVYCLLKKEFEHNLSFSGKCGSRGFAKLCFGIPFLLFTLIYRIVGIALLITFLQVWNGVIIFNLFFINVLTALFVGDNFVRWVRYQENKKYLFLFISSKTHLSLNILVYHYNFLGLQLMVCGPYWFRLDTIGTQQLISDTKKLQ